MDRGGSLLLLEDVGDVPRVESDVWPLANGLNDFMHLWRLLQHGMLPLPSLYQICSTLYGTQHSFFLDSKYFLHIIVVVNCAHLNKIAVL